MRRLLPLLLLTGLVAGCSATPEAAPTEDPLRETLLGSLREEVSQVAQTQADADEELNEVLEVVRRLDEAVGELEREETFDEALSDHGDLHEEVAETSVDEELREAWFDVADDVDEARSSLAGSREVLDDEWEVRYLDAQDEVLVAVREYARAADRLTQLVIRHWPTYEEVDESIVEFADGRGNHRDTAEARDALLVELDPFLPELETAQEQLAEYRERRSEAGAAVNDATADAVTVYEQRPGADALRRSP